MNFKIAFTVVDVLNQERINPEISRDNTIFFLKQALFYIEPSYYPKFIRFDKVDDDDKFIFDALDDNNEIKMYQLGDELVNDDEIDLKTLAKLSNSGVLDNSISIFSNIFEKYSNLYKNITQEDFTFLIRRLTDDESDDVEQYFDNVFAQHEEIKKSYSKIFGNNTYQNFINSDITLDSFNIMQKLSNVTFLINTNWNKENVIFKLFDMFNFLELNNDIPLIALNKKYADKKAPLIKVYDNFLKVDNISDKVFKNWIITERKIHSSIKYKLIKGLFIKKKINIGDNFLSINMYANGYITATLDDALDLDYDDIVSNVKECLQDLFKIFNKMSKNIFVNKKFKLEIDSLELLNTDIVFILKDSVFNIDSFKKAFKNIFISETFFKLKSTKYTDILSFQYNNVFNETKDFTINMQNEKYNPNGIIKIFDINNLYLSKTILQNILILKDIFQKDLETGYKQKQKTQKKILGEQGVLFNPKKCQGDRQPRLLADGEEGDGALLFNDKNFICSNDQYPHIGFTDDNIVCCFKKIQTGSLNYIKNTDPKSLEIQVQPSNYKININKKYVNAIKIDDSYYYISPGNNPLVKITDSKIINELDSVDPWLEKVPLANVIYKISSNKCSYWPDFEKGGDDACTNHPSRQYFGYTQKGEPCCFAKPKDYVVDEESKTQQKRYIITDQKKILSFNKLGELPTVLQDILKEIDKTKKFYRLGVLQNENSFINTISSAIGYSVKTIRNNMIEFLKDNSDIFYTLSDGSISTIWNKDDYLDYLKRDDSVIYVSDFLDLIELVFKIDIAILDYDNTTNNIKISCRKNIIKKETGPGHTNNVVILKINNVYNELIVYLDDDGKIHPVFSQDEIFVKFIKAYYSDSCKIESVYPKNFPFIMVERYDTILEKYKKDNVLGDIEYQILNAFNKVNYLMTSKKVLIPVEEIGVIHDSNIKIKNFKDLINKNILLKYSDIKNVLKHLSKNLDIPEIKLIGFSYTEYPNIVACLTNRGVIIPVINDGIDFDKELSYKYILNTDIILDSKTLPQPEDLSKFKEFNLDIAKLNMIIKKNIGENISDQSKEKIMSIIKSANMTRYIKINEIKKIIMKYTSSFKSEFYYDLVIGSISNEMLNDNVENLILNNIMIPNYYSKGDIISRDRESVLFNIKDIKDWVSKFA